MNSFCSFSTPHHQESIQLCLCTQVVQTELHHLQNEFIRTCWGLEWISSAQALGVRIPCSHHALPGGSLCTQESLGHSKLLCSTKILTHLRNFALGVKNGHCAFFSHFLLLLKHIHGGAAGPAAPFLHLLPC